MLACRLVGTITGLAGTLAGLTVYGGGPVEPVFSWRVAALIAVYFFVVAASVEDACVVLRGGALGLTRVFGFLLVVGSYLLSLGVIWSAAGDCIMPESQISCGEVYAVAASQAINVYIVGASVLSLVYGVARGRVRL